MINTTRHVLLAVHLLILAIASPQAMAVLKNSEFSVTVIPAEGNGVCKDYGSNDFIKEMQLNLSCPNNGGWRQVMGPDGATAEIKYDCTTHEVSFRNSSEGINYSVTKTSRNITWYPYGTMTRDADSRITNQDPYTGDVNPMARVALCYGLPVTDITPEPETIPICDSAEDDGWLSVVCGTSENDGTVVTLWQPLENDDRISQCVCNNGGSVETIVECDPSNSVADEVLGPCYDKSVGQPKATTVVEFDADPIICTTSGGDRTCKCVDNPFTPLINECAWPRQ